MILLWLYLLSFMVFPIVGEFIIWYGNMQLQAGNIDFSLIINNIIFTVIIILIAYGIQKYKFKENFIYYKFNYFFVKKVFTRSIILLSFFILIVFTLSGWKILLHLADRGEIRASLGILGPFYTWIILFIIPGIIIFNSIIYIHLEEKLKKRFKYNLFFLYFLAIISGILTGYKATFIIIVIGGIIVLTYHKLPLKKSILLGLFSILALDLTTSFFQEIDIITAMNFLLYRLTIMTVYGTIGVWNNYPNGITIDDFLLNSLGVFGNKISSILLSEESTSSITFLKTNLALLISYETYPDTTKVLSGEVNVTVTNFGESIYLFGKELYIIYALVSGLIVGIVIRKFKEYVLHGVPIKATLLGVYLFSVIIPWFNSACIWNLISLPTIIGLLNTYIVLYLLIKIKPIK